MMQRSALTLEYVAFRVDVKKNGVRYNPTVDTVRLAFMVRDADGVASAPASGDWKAGDWETDATGPYPVYFARCLVGPSGTVNPAANSYDVWVDIADSPEHIVRKVDVLTLT